MFHARLGLLAATALIGFTLAAQASPIEAFLTEPAATGGTLTPIDLQGIATPSQSVIDGNGYTITFNNLASGQGVVQGTDAGAHATPVAGTLDGQNEYLTGGYGSVLTTNLADSGNYLSAGDTGSITIQFATPQTSFALLWGSVDTLNDLTVSLGNSSSPILDVTGTEIQQAAEGFTSNGSQSFGGSAWVIIDPGSTFDTVTLSSGTVAFESAALVGSTGTFNVPEPVSIVLLGAGLVGLGFVRHRRHAA